VIECGVLDCGELAEAVESILEARDESSPKGLKVNGFVGAGQEADFHG
jgi:hypothetical protein